MALAVIAVVGFAAFMIWELTEEHPIVDIRVFRHRGFAFGTLTICLTFGAFFATAVLAPLWMQTSLGYTASDAGFVMGMNGVLAVLVAPNVARFMGRVDGRKMVFFGVMWLAAMVLWRSFYTTEVTMWQLAFPVLIQGIGMPFFFIPLTTIALSAVEEEETASAAGLFNFARSLSGAFSVSIVTTLWQDDAAANHDQLVGHVDRFGTTLNTLMAGGMTHQQALVTLDNMLTQQSVMLATNHVFQILVIGLVAAAFSIWMAPKPSRETGNVGGH